MNRTLLALVAGLAVGLAGIRFFLGDSILVMPAFFLLVFLALEWVSGRRRWLQAALGAGIATAVHAVFTRFISA